MKKEIAERIKAKAVDIEKMFSLKVRAFNYGQEIFVLRKIVPLSENSAVALYEKEPTKKWAMAYIQFIDTGLGGHVDYFFVKYQHLYDFEKVKVLMAKVEAHNFGVGDCSEG